MNITVKMITDHAREIEAEDPIDFGMLSIDEDATFNMIASSVLGHYEALDPDVRDLMMLSVVTKLVVENFVLNLKLQKQ